MPLTLVRTALTPGRRLYLGTAIAALSLCAQEPANQAMWAEVESKPGATRDAAAPGPRVHLVNEWRFDAALRAAPMEFSRAPISSHISLPMPDGTYQTFSVEESPIMQPGLASRYPMIRSYALRGVDDPTIRGRLDRNPRNLNALLLTREGGIEIHPEPGAGHPRYLSHRGAEAGDTIECGVHETPEAAASFARWKQSAVRAAGTSVGERAIASGSTLRTYRLAVATTGEYYAGRGGNDVDVLSSINAVMNAVNAIYESEVSIRFILIGNNDDLFFTDPDTDGYSNTVPCTMRGENVTVTNATIDEDDYDIGHVFGTSPGGGCAAGSVACGANKANGASGLNVGAAPDQTSFGGFKLVSHEIGHQMSAAHSWSGVDGNCSADQFAAGSSYEPLGGTTIMAYSGTCGVDNIQNTAVDPYFHTHSHEQIVSFSTLGGGNACAAQINTGNAVPVVNAGPDYTIPQDTPFTLTGSANDADDASLTYAWEQYDAAGAQISPLTDQGNNPLFRSFPPDNTPSRTFPQISDILNDTTTIGELLPTTNRTMNFRLTARDNRAAGGGVDSDNMVVTVSGDPFRITSPNGGEVLNAGCQVPVTWQVGGGAVAANVDLLYSNNGGQNFSPLFPGAGNDGSQEVSISCAATNQGRVRANAVGNIFFDISDANFSVQANAPTVVVDADGGEVDDQCQFTVPFSVTITDDCSVTAANVAVEVTETSGLATIGVPVINKVQQNGTTVTVSGTVLVSGLTGSPAIVRVRITATDGCGIVKQAMAEAQVEDTTPPDITVTLNPSVIWAPNHNMININAQVVVTDNCPVTSFILSSVTSSEPDDTTGDGAFINDIQGVSPGTADTTFQVRAERVGAGPGRTYTANYTATDGSGNQKAGSAKVLVPSNQSSN